MNKRLVLRKSRQRRIRAKIFGTAIRPRLSVYRSNAALYVQVIDDEKHHTIDAAMTKGVTVENAKKLGEEISKKVLKAKIGTIVFDRGGYKYHGVIKALADSVRSAGIIF